MHVVSGQAGPDGHTESGESFVLQKAQPQEPECTGLGPLPALAANAHVVTQICSPLVNAVQFGT